MAILAASLLLLMLSSLIDCRPGEPSPSPKSLRCGVERHLFRQIVDVELDQLSKHLAAMRERLLDVILAADLGEGVKVHGPRDSSLRLPNTLSIGIAGVEARALLEKVGQQRNAVVFLFLQR